MDNNKTLQPLSVEELELMQQLAGNLTSDKAMWMNGYLHGFVQANAVLQAKASQKQIQTDESTKSEVAPAVEAQSAADDAKVSIVYGSHTGNSKKIASWLSTALETNGKEVTVEDMDEYNVRSLKDEQVLLVIVSTHGEGEPPLMAEDFYEFIHSPRAPKLDKLKYAVLALGDKSYFHFCKTGSDIDARLSALGATAITPRVDCDVDFKGLTENWINTVVESLGKIELPDTSAVSVVEASAKAPVSYSLENPCEATVLEKINLNGRGATKSTWHIELQVSDDFSFQPGDALGVIPQNDIAEVEALLSDLKLSKTDNVEYNGESLTLENYLLNYAEITSLSRDALFAINAKIQNAQLTALLENQEQLADYLFKNDLRKFIRDFNLSLAASDLPKLLRKLQPRMYSIASSHELIPGEVHLTVGLLELNDGERSREGVCSSYLANRLNAGDIVKVYIDENDNFRLPEDDTDIIMVGPGTGVAPFRAFVQEREARGSKGKSWLFFGDRNFTTDFLYQTEWQKYLQKKKLTKMDVAFSRDQKEKIYVQHKIEQNSKEIYEWLQNGASVYVCGDRKHMAPDVMKAFEKVVQKEGGLSAEDAKAYVKQLRKSKKYLEDVY